jgi:hypothetical protein
MKRRALILLSLAALWLSACGPREEVVYYPTGEVEYRVPLDRRGLLEGELKSFYKSGRSRRITPFYKDRITGLVREYYPTGQLKSSECFKNGERFGPAKGYYPSGRLLYRATKHGSVYVDTTFWYHPNGEVRNLIIHDGNGRPIDFGVWRANGAVDTSYTRPFFLTDGDTVRDGRDYAFEVVLGNRRSSAVQIKVLHPATGVDSTKGVYSRTRFLYRCPVPGRHTFTVMAVNRWARKGSDTIWVDRYKPISKSFWVLPAQSAE